MRWLGGFPGDSIVCSVRSFAVATYVRPEVLLIDEVLGVGDAQFKEKAKKTMSDMIQSDQTVVLVSHSAGAMTELCNRVVWIEQGEVVAQGEPEEIIERYNETSRKKRKKKRGRKW